MNTPVKTAAAQDAAAGTDSPGTWRHPRLDEITRRRNASTFAESNVRRIMYNVSTLLCLWCIRVFARMYLSWSLVPPAYRQHVSWAWLGLQFIPCANIGMACLPLVRRKDDLSDIPLTPAQRKLLGLSPSSAPPTPDAKYSTPPRYSRTPSISGSAGSRGSYNSSPLSGRGSPLLGGSSGSPYSPAGSPLQKRASSDFTSRRRSSLGSGSLFGTPLGPTSSSRLRNDPQSPSPSGGKRASVGLNNKWLYERSRRSSGSAWLQ